MSSRATVSAASSACTVLLQLCTAAPVHARTCPTAGALDRCTTSERLLHLAHQRRDTVTIPAGDHPLRLCCVLACGGNPKPRRLVHIHGRPWVGKHPAKQYCVRTKRGSVPVRFLKSTVNGHFLRAHLLDQAVPPPCSNHWHSALPCAAGTRSCSAHRAGAPRRSLTSLR